MNCVKYHLSGGKVEGRRGRRYKQLLNEVKERTGYCKLQEEVLGRSLWRTGTGIGCAPVVMQTAE
jgi:hypothetical protein